MKVAFLDRDGTIIRDYLDSEWSTVEEPVFLEGALEGLRRLNDLDYGLIIVTNQYLINENYISLDQYEKIQSKVEEILRRSRVRVLATYYCPHSRQENCDCRKPKSGMIKKALKDFSEIDLSSCIMIGDSLCDQQMSDSLQIKFFALNNGNQDIQPVYKSIEDIAVLLAQKNI